MTEINDIALRLAARIFGQRLIANQYRSAFIEAMIEPHLEPFGWRYVGDGWSGWDFEHYGGHRLEVKQSAAQQTWSAPRRLRTRGAFDIAARTGYYYEGGSKYAAVPGRCAQTYVFAWNGFFDSGEHPLKADHRCPEQWEFYVVPTADLPRQAQKTIGLSAIRKLADPVGLSHLGVKVNALTLSQPTRSLQAK
jgi:hypothetical protein